MCVGVVGGGVAASGHILTVVSHILLMVVNFSQPRKCFI